jgi:hypothetical protein
MQKKLYVLTRKDLSKSQQAVQAGHAVAEYLLRGPSTSWDNGTLVYLGVKDEKELLFWGKVLDKHSDVIMFREPDRDNEVTALATVSGGEALSKLRLL